jgi:uncharacterized protein (TIGR03435 family)
MKLCTKVLILAMACTATGYGQGADLSGTWQGTLMRGRPLRNVFRISKVDGVYKATDFSIDLTDSPANPAYVRSTTLEGMTVRMDILAVGAVFEGKLSPDGNTITGTWTQGSSQPLVLVRATSETAWPLPPVPQRLPLMGADAKPSFGVAIIRPSNPDARSMRFLARGRRYTTTNTSLRDLLLEAYELHPRQLTGLQGWMETDKWDVSGLPDLDGLPSWEQWKAMLRRLLGERFQLKFHTEQKELSVYELTSLKPAAAAASKLSPSEGNADGVPHLNFRGAGHLLAQNSNMKDLAEMMQQHMVDRPVVDQTAILGRFDFRLDWAPDDAPADLTEASPALFQAIQDQLGLRLTAKHEQVNVMVIDHAEKPSAN